MPDLQKFEKNVNWENIENLDMKRIIITVICSLTIGLLIFNCKKSITSVTPLKNAITYNGTEYDLNTGILEYYGKLQGTGINFDLIFLSSGLVPVTNNGMVDSITGTGNGINFEIFSTGTTALNVGDYTFDASKTGTAGTFDFANTILNFNTVNQQGIDLDMNGGKVTIKQNGSVYELTFNCTGVDGKSVTGYFKGSLQYYNNTGIAKSARLKKHRKW